MKIRVLFLALLLSFTSVLSLMACSEKHGESKSLKTDKEIADETSAEESLSDIEASEESYEDSVLDTVESEEEAESLPDTEASKESYEDSVLDTVESEEEAESLPDTEASEESYEDSVLDTVESEEEAESGECTPLLYKAEDADGDTLYLFGTIHLGDDRTVFPDYVINAYNESDFLCVEADVTAFSEDMDLQLEVMKKMLCELGKSAVDYLGEELYNSAVAFLEEKDLYVSVYDYYRPIMWESLLLEALIDGTDFSSEQGADMLLLNMAKNDGKEVREAEGFAHQYDLLMSAGDEPLVISIENMMAIKDVYAQETNELYELWLEGDEEKFSNAIISDYSELDEADEAIMLNYENIIVEQRNLAMADLAEEYLEEGKTGFFAVGAAHVIGDGALAQLLTDRGYTVTIVE